MVTNNILDSEDQLKEKFNITINPRDNQIFEGLYKNLSVEADDYYAIGSFMSQNAIGNNIQLIIKKVNDLVEIISARIVTHADKQIINLQNNTDPYLDLSKFQLYDSSFYFQPSIFIKRELNKTKSFITSTFNFSTTFNFNYLAPMNAFTKLPDKYDYNFTDDKYSYE